MIVAILVIAFFALLTLSDFIGPRDHDRQSPTPPHDPIQQHPPYHHPSPYHDPYHRREPVYSPHGRYMWDGQRWVPNHSNIGFGLVVGILVVLLVSYVF